MKKIILIIFSFSLYAQNNVCFEIEPNPYPNSAYLGCFSKYIKVLDCFEIYAQSGVQDEKVLHVAAVAAELLDNDEDGIVDDPLLYSKLAEENALMPIFTYDGNSCMDDFEDHYNGDGVSAVLFRNEIDPNNPGHWGDDATVEEVVHTINHVGHVSLYPSYFNINPNSSVMSDAMDVARGGQFLNVPSNYPEEAWYHYDDWTCDYQCMAIEYMYWCIVTNMGILDDPQTCSGIANEWEPCTPELFQNTDVTMFNLITNPIHKLPQNAPDGNYCPQTGLIGDINDDSVVDVLDIILTINIILGQAPIDYTADMNSDGIINILDIVLLVSVVLNPEGLSEECYLTPDPGPCLAYVPMYYFNEQTELCEMFAWGGCGGMIPFETLESCQQSCEE